MEERLAGGSHFARTDLQFRSSPWRKQPEQMTSMQEDWSEWDITSNDGLEELPWDHRAPRKVAEP